MIPANSRGRRTAASKASVIYPHEFCECRKGLDTDVDRILASAASDINNILHACLAWLI